MPVTGLLALLDDIATILDDVALMTKVAAKQSSATLDDVSLMTKVAAKKTAGVLGDDLALNAQQVAGVASERELPVVWAVAKGSLVNKLILIPAALLISAFAPWLITPLLMCGGAFLCFEGAEKIALRLFRHESAPVGLESPEAPVASALDVAALEKTKIIGAIRTDFVLSAEIIVIALGTMPVGGPFLTRALVISLIAVIMTVGVYGLVAGIVKLDDAGFYLLRVRSKGLLHRLGAGLVNAAPLLMRGLGVVGTVAMFMVGGGILAHGLPFLHGVAEMLAGLPLAGLLESLANAVLGVAAGLLLLGAVGGMKRVAAVFRR